MTGQIRPSRSRNTSSKKYNQVRASVAPFSSKRTEAHEILFYVLFYFFMLRLEFPDTSHKTEYLSMIEDWISHEVPSSPGALFRGETFEEFLQLTKDDLEKGNRH